MKKHTIEEALAYVKEHRKELIESLQACEEAPDFFKTPGNKFEEVWCSGCWMNNCLYDAGATEKEVQDIGFAHGQRTLFGDPYKWAVAYLNEFEENREVKDKPGIALADEINGIHLQVGKDHVAIAIEENSKP